MQPLVLSQFCIASSLGLGLEATLAALQSGKSGLIPCAFETVDLPTYVGEVTGLDEQPLPAALQKFECRNNRLAYLALAQDGFLEAVASAKAKYGAHRIGLFLGTSTSGILESERAYRDRDPETGTLKNSFSYAETQNTFSVAAFVSHFLGLSGPTFVVSAACASTTKAFGNAQRMIEAGLCDAAIVGGADSLCLTTLYGFHSLMLTSPLPCRPFDQDRDGISIGEAAGFALVEKSDSMNSVDAIHLLGVGESSDAYHMSSPHPEGLGAKLAMERALMAARLEPTAIDYINLHGTATKAGDAAEDKAITSLFADTVPCSSTKGYTGHTLGAAGIVESIITALSLRHGFMPGTGAATTLDPNLRAAHLLKGRPAPLRYAMNNSFGFGGSNCSLILGRG